MATRDEQVTWARVEDGFYVASRGGNFLGFVERTERGGFVVHDGEGTALARHRELTVAMGVLDPASRTDGSDAPAKDVEPLWSVVYTSVADRPVSDDDLADLLDRSRRGNAARGVTGMLLYRDSRFLQVLEGPRDVVHDLLGVIRDDPSHRDVRVMIDDPLTVRQFPDWTMGFEPLEPPTEPRPEGFRDSFTDLDGAADDEASLRAARELSRWFRFRAQAAAAG